jgi:hypothetical protein
LPALLLFLSVLFLGLVVGRWSHRLRPDGRGK